MATSTSWRQILLGLAGLLFLAAVSIAAVYALGHYLTGTVGGAVAGGVVAVAVAVVSKSFEHQKQQEAALAEKKREVYRRMLAPWEQVLVAGKAGKAGDDLLANVDLAAVYSSAFDAVLYGSEAVVQKYAAFRSPDPTRDPIDMMRSLAALLVAMREDVTGKKASLPVEAVLGTFMNLSDEELVVLRLRDYVATHPDAQKKLAAILAPTENTDTQQPPAGAR